MLENRAIKLAVKLAVVSTAVLSVLLYTGCDKNGQTHAPATPEVVVAKVMPEQVVLTTELPGRTSPYRIAEIRPQVNGLILKRFFTEGADVKQGDVLYQIDPAPFQAALDNAEAALGRSKANLPAIQSRAERFKELVADKAVSQQEYDDASAALRQLEADIKSYEAMVKTARINLQYTRIKAPISGRIGRSSVTEGAIVTAYQPLALSTIQQLDPIYVDVQQSTSELLRLQQHLNNGKLDRNNGNIDNVKLLMLASTSYPLEGTLQFRDITVNPSTSSVTLRIVFPNPDGQLLPGMFVRAIVQEGVNEGEILVPQQGVTRDRRGNPYALIVSAENKIEQRSLVLDRAIGDRWLVEEGLEAGDRVVVEGIQKVRPGATVRIASAAGSEAESNPAQSPANNGGK